jgi:hypothetical protein
MTMKFLTLDFVYIFYSFTSTYTTLKEDILFMNNDMFICMWAHLLNDFIHGKIYISQILLFSLYRLV